MKESLTVRAIQSSPQTASPRPWNLLEPHINWTQPQAYLTGSSPGDSPAHVSVGGTTLLPLALFLGHRKCSMNTCRIELIACLWMNQAFKWKHCLSPSMTEQIRRNNTSLSWEHKVKQTLKAAPSHPSGLHTVERLQGAQVLMVCDEWVKIPANSYLTIVLKLSTKWKSCRRQETNDNRACDT